MPTMSILTPENTAHQYNTAFMPFFAKIEAEGILVV